MALLLQGNIPKEYVSGSVWTCDIFGLLDLFPTVGSLQAGSIWTRSSPEQIYLGLTHADLKCPQPILYVTKI